MLFMPKQYEVRLQLQIRVPDEQFDRIRAGFAIVHRLYHCSDTIECLSRDQNLRIKFALSCFKFIQLDEEANPTSALFEIVRNRRKTIL